MSAKTSLPPPCVALDGHHTWTSTCHPGKITIAAGASAFFLGAEESKQSSEVFWVNLRGSVVWGARSYRWRK